MTRTLADAVAQVESGGYYRAERFEPLVFAKLSNGSLTPDHAAIVGKIKSVHRCTTQTAMVIYSTSYGGFQIMGFNIWGSLGLSFHKIDWCDNIAVQQQKFAEHVTRLGIAFDPATILASPDKARTFAERYNGPGDIEGYAQRLVEALS